MNEHDKVVSELCDIVSEVVGSEMAELLGVSSESSFVGDLEMDSIQIVAVIQQAQELYGDKVDLVAWLSKQPLRQLFKLTIGDVANAICG
jgi:acyl carrier protein